TEMAVIDEGVSLIHDRLEQFLIIRRQRQLDMGREGLRATVNQGNPFSDYGHFRLKMEVTLSPWVITMGSGPSQVSENLLSNMLGMFDPARDVGDGSLMKYTLLRPPSDAREPEDGWPLIVVNPGVGAIGQSGLSSSLGSATQWASPYHRKHYPAYVLRWHPQDRVTTPSGRHETTVEPAYEVAMEFLDKLIDSEPIDRNRIYVMGFSMGGRTTWRNLMDRPDFFAAAVPHSGGGPFPPGSSDASRIIRVPVWMMIGNQDPWQGSARYIRVYQDLVEAGAEHVRFWEQQDIGHHSFTLRSFHLPEWMFSYSLEDDFRAMAPTVLEDPATLMVVEGEPLELKSNFMGAPAPEVEWRKDGTVITGANSYYYTLARTRLEDGGFYDVRATNAHGEAITETAEVMVLPDTDPPEVLMVAAIGEEALSVTFDEPVAAGMEEGGSEDPLRYRLSPEGTVLGAELQENDRTVVLSVEGLVDGNAYSLFIEPVRDRAATPNTSAISRLSFLFQPSLVGHWQLDDDGGLTAADNSGKGNAAVLSRKAEWTSGRIAGGLTFNGDSTRLEVPMEEMDPEAGTLAIWAKRVGEGSARRQAIVDKSSSTDPDSRLGIRLTKSTGFLSFALGDQTSISAGESLGESWAHLALTWENGDYTAYINGELVASGAYGAHTHAGEPLQVANTSTGGQGFAGAVDDLRLYNRSLSAEEIASLHIDGITPPEPVLRDTRLLPDGQIEISLQVEPGVQYELVHSPSLEPSTEWTSHSDSRVVADSEEIRFTFDPETWAGFLRVIGQYPE
ncbi:MAG: LamG-like jellyroll fold domain-containing protein, partial [Oceanipulchritudo sp.]